MICPQCGKDVVGNASFCSNCGSALNQQPQLNTLRAENTQYGYEGNTPPPPPEYMGNPYSYTPTPAPTPTPAQPQNAQNPYPYVPPPPQPPNSQSSYPYMPISPTAPTIPQSPQSPKRKNGAIIAIVAAIIALIVISSIIGFAVIRQQSIAHTNATATASSSTATVGTANAYATSTVVAQASATAQARANPYSPTMPTLSATTLTSAQDTANWDSNANCTYKQGYVISTTDGQLNSCNYNGTSDADYTAEVSITLNNSNSQGGMILRQTTTALEILYVERGQVTLQLYDSQKKQNVILKTASAPITPGTSALVAAVVDHGTLKVFVNHAQALSIDDNRADIAQGYSFALMDGSTDSAASSATYNNLRLWTV